MHREKDACDVLVRMDDGLIYTATFVTFDYIKRQMDLNHAVARELEDTPCVRYAVIDTVHVVVESLVKDVIEDTIDNLLALDVFESYFVRVTETEAERITRTNKRDQKRATKEHAAVVISEVLVVNE
ncbi:MAG: hypothetical protein SNJ54_02715 [Anaerolineae bacterium]